MLNYCVRSQLLDIGNFQKKHSDKLKIVDDLLLDEILSLTTGLLNDYYNRYLVDVKKGIENIDPLREDLA